MFSYCAKQDMGVVSYVLPIVSWAYQCFCCTKSIFSFDKYFLRYVFFIFINRTLIWWDNGYFSMSLVTSSYKWKRVIKWKKKIIIISRWKSNIKGWFYIIKLKLNSKPKIIITTKQWKVIRLLSSDVPQVQFLCLHPALLDPPPVKQLTDCEYMYHLRYTSQ